ISAGSATAQSRSVSRDVLLLRMVEAQMDDLAAQSISSSQGSSLGLVSNSQGGQPPRPVSASQAGTPSIIGDPTTSPLSDGFASIVMGLIPNQNKIDRIRGLQSALAVVEHLQQLRLTPSLSAQLRLIREQIMARLTLLLS